MRARCLGVALLAAFGARAGAQAVEQRAFVAVATPRSAVFVGERLPVRLEFGLEIAFLEDHVLQPFQRPLDVPVRIVAPGLEPAEPDATDGTAATLGFALGDAIAAARPAGERLVDGRRFAVFVSDHTWLAREPGERTLPPPELHLRYATRFHDDFLTGRVAEDPTDAAVFGEPLRLTVAPLPRAGRPDDFSGAVGRFTVRATAEPRTLAVGESLALTLHIEGHGDLRGFATPRLDALEGFHVYGFLERFDAAARTITYDLAPRSRTVTAVPAIRFSFFDPGPPAGYRTVLTDPLPLTVHSGAGGLEELPPEPETGDVPEVENPAPVPGVDDIHDVEPLSGASRAAAGRASGVAWLAALLAPWLLALGALAWRRGRERTARHAADRDARVALAAVVDPDPAPGAGSRALIRYLAVRLGCPEPVVLAPDLDVRLIAAGASASLARRTVAAVDELQALRFGGEPGASAGAEHRERLRTLARELEAALAPAEGAE